MEHSNLGASSSGRWMVCTASPNEISKLPKSMQDKSSVYANEGSAAHCLGELIALHVINLWQAGKELDTALLVPMQGLKLAQTKQEHPEYVIYDGDDPFGIQPYVYKDEVNLEEDHFVCDEEMEESVRFYAMEMIRILDEGSGEYEVLVEQRVYPIALDKKVFGTSDLIIWDIGFQLLSTLDLKYGKGVVVSAHENTQAMFYAAGAMQKWGISDSAMVDLVIVQPRIKFDDGTSISRSVMPAGDLRRWAEQELKGKVEETKDPHARVFVAGDYCKWCAAAGSCPLMQAQASAKAKEVFGGDVDLLSFDEVPGVSLIFPDTNDLEGLSKAVKIAMVLEVWANRVKEMAEAQVIEGKSVPGFKRVRKKTNRRWQDSAEVEAFLKEEGLYEEVVKKQLPSPAALEKVIGKETVAKYAIKPEGGMTMAPESDRRKEISTAASVFAQGKGEKIDY